MTDGIGPVNDGQSGAINKGRFDPELPVVTVCFRDGQSAILLTYRLAGFFELLPVRGALERLRSHSRA
jgi:hypothetical protein